MHRYKFEFRLVHEIHAEDKKEAIKKARKIMRKHNKGGYWFEAHVTRID